jgi:hypothetical protein
VAAGHVHVEPGLAAEHEGNVECVRDDRYSAPTEKVGRYLRCRGAGVQNDRFAVADECCRRTTDCLLRGAMALVLQRHCAYLVRYGLKVGSAVFAHDVPIGLELFEVLAHRHFGNVEGGSEGAYACAAFLPQPLEHAGPPGLAEEAAWHPGRPGMLLCVRPGYPGLARHGA